MYTSLKYIHQTNYIIYAFMNQRAKIFKLSHQYLILNNINLNVELQIFIHIVDVIEDILYNSRNNPLVDWIIKMTLKE